VGIVKGEVSSEIRGSTKERRQLPGYSGVLESRWPRVGRHHSVNSEVNWVCLRWEIRDPSRGGPNQ